VETLEHRSETGKGQEAQVDERNARTRGELAYGEADWGGNEKTGGRE